MRRRWVGAAAVLLSLASASPAAAEVGACTWAAVSPATRAEFLAAYAGAVRAGTQVLSRHDAELQAENLRCVGGRSDVPGAWRDFAVAAAAIREGASVELRKAGGPDAAALDAAWASAPNAVRASYRANAGRLFGSKASSPGVKPAADYGIALVGRDRKRLAELTTFFNATAQGEHAEAFIAKYLAQCSPPSKCAKR